MRKPRTFFMDSNLNSPTVMGSQCVVCGRRVIDPHLGVWSANYLDAVHPNDIDLVNIKNESGPCELLYIGPDCAKKIPQGFLVDYKLNKQTGGDGNETCARRL